MAQIKNIQGIKIGSIVNVSLNGKLHKKNCGTILEADELFRLVLKAKDNPSDENIKAIRAYLNDSVRVAMLAGLENDPDSGEVFLGGFNTPIPGKLVEIIREYHENNYPLTAIINFWKLLMINPDVRVRTSLFSFIATHDFVLTDMGYMVVYKAVAEKAEEKKPYFLGEYVSNQYFHVKKDWKCSPNKYTVYEDKETGSLALTKNETIANWNLPSAEDGVPCEDELNIAIIGKLGELYDSIFKGDNAEISAPVYSDMKTKTMNIVLGQPVVMERKNCDSDPAIDCSYGLHVGSTKYVEKFGNGTNTVLVCLVNPANVVAVPDYDHSKMRVSEYFPFAVATYIDNKIDIVSQPYYEEDYCAFETKEIEKLVAKVKAGEKPIEKAMNAEEEQRPMFELMKILETRLIDLSVM
jgi:hypothetical protein